MTIPKFVENNKYFWNNERIYSLIDYLKWKAAVDFFLININKIDVTYKHYKNNYNFFFKKKVNHQNALDNGKYM